MRCRLAPSRSGRRAGRRRPSTSRSRSRADACSVRTTAAASAPCGAGRCGHQLAPLTVQRLPGGAGSSISAASASATVRGERASSTTCGKGSAATKLACAARSLAPIARGERRWRARQAPRGEGSRSGRPTRCAPQVHQGTVRCMRKPRGDRRSSAFAPEAGEEDPLPLAFARPERCWMSAQSGRAAAGRCAPAAGRPQTSRPSSETRHEGPRRGTRTQRPDCRAPPGWKRCSRR